MKSSVHTSKNLNRLSAYKISRILRQARIKNRYSINDLHRITRIKLVDLRAIDSGNFNKISEGFYLRAFIRKYADTVGINGIELLKRFNNELPNPHDPRYIGKVSENKLLNRAIEQRAKNRRLTIHKYIPLLTLILVALLILTGIWILASRNHSGFTSHYNRHSVAMSGETLKKRKRKVRHRTRKKSFVIKKGVRSGDRLTYRVIAKVHSLRLTLSSPALIKMTLGSSGKGRQQLTLPANRKRVIRLPKRDDTVSLDLSRQDSVELKIDQKVKKQLSPQRSARSVVLKFSK